MLTDEESLGAEEKIKQLIDFENDKRKELEAKKKEFEDKKKELEQLEIKKKKETEEVREEIEDKIEELQTEETRRFEELEEIRRRREAETPSLEESVEEEERRGRIREVPRQRGYGEAIEGILRGNPGIYDITNYNVMNRLENIARDARERPLTTGEREFIDLVQYHAERMADNEFYRSKDTNDYMTRELKKIDQINKTMREREQPGEYHP